MTVHDFAESLEVAAQHADAPWWAEVYRQAFPTMTAMRYIHKDGWAQRSGIDRLIDLADGTTLKVDEKVRSKVWPDFALERWSDTARRSPGWMQKPLTCDFIAYAFIPSATCYLLPWQLLRRAWRTHGRDWIARYPSIYAQNRGYRTESVPVPIGVVLEALTDSLLVRWSGDASVIPLRRGA